MKIETMWQAENKALKYNVKNPVNYHYLLGENSIDELIYENFLDSFNNNMQDFDAKKVDFFEFLDGKTEKNVILEENPKNEVGVIENLDQIEELIEKWEKERDVKKERQKKEILGKRNRKETLISSDKSSGIQMIGSGSGKEGKKRKRDLTGHLIRKKRKISSNVITILE